MRHSRSSPSVFCFAFELTLWASGKVSECFDDVLEPSGRLRDLLFYSTFRTNDGHCSISRKLFGIEIHALRKVLTFWVWRWFSVDFLTSQEPRKSTPNTLKWLPNFRALLHKACDYHRTWKDDWTCYAVSNVMNFWGILIWKIFHRPSRCLHRLRRRTLCQPVFRVENVNFASCFLWVKPLLRVCILWSYDIKQLMCPSFHVQLHVYKIVCVVAYDGNEDVCHRSHLRVTVLIFVASSPLSTSDVKQTYCK